MGQSQWMLVAVEGRFAGKHFPIPERGLAFGREDDNDLVLEDDNVSRHHAIVRAGPGRPILEDLKSRNGTFVNNQKVSRLELQEGDRIALGSHLFKVMPAPLEKAAQAPGSVAGPPTADQERTIVYQRPSPRGRSDLAATRAIQVTGGDPGFGGMLTPNTSEGEPQQYARPGAFNLASGGESGNGGAPLLGGEAGLAQWQQEPGGVAETALASDAGLPLTGGEPGIVPEFGPISEPVAPLDYQPRKRSRVGLYAGAAVVLVLAIVGSVWVTTQGNERAMAPSAGSESSVMSVNRSIYEKSASGSELSGRKPVVLSPEEEALSPTEKETRANEHFDQGESYMLSDKLKQAREEFERALLLNPDCKVCLIRLSKVESEIKKSLEKYKGDALRSFQAMEYDKARRYWEMVLELESDPEGQRVAREGIQNARAQLHQQSYR